MIEELYFSEILGYEKIFRGIRDRRLVLYIIPKNSSDKMDISLFSQNREVLSFIKNNFNSL